MWTIQTKHTNQYKPKQTIEMGKKVANETENSWIVFRQKNKSTSE